VSPRRYTLGARAAAVADTRERVLAAARDLYRDDGFHRSPLDEVARRADVARATVYQRFGSKLGLLEAVLTDYESRADLPALAAVVHEGPPETLLRMMITDGCRYWSTDPALARKIIAAGSADPAAGELLRRHDAGRLALLETTVRRLDEVGRLTLPPGPALDVLWVLTAFETYDQLAAGRGLSTADAADVLAGLAEARLGG
jgi:AcrR family transcriptional regulator